MIQVALLAGVAWLAISFLCAHVWVTVAIAHERTLRAQTRGARHRRGLTASTADLRTRVWQLENDPVARG